MKVLVGQYILTIPQGQGQERLCLLLISELQISPTSMHSERP